MPYLQDRRTAARLQDVRQMSGEHCGLYRSEPQGDQRTEADHAEDRKVERQVIHYHGTPITPKAVMRSLAGRNFCVRYGAHQGHVGLAHEIGQSVMLDNGAFSFWRTGAPTDWNGYMEWVTPWLDYPTTWAVIPDVIEGSEDDNDRLICEWYATMKDFRQAAPVWHLHESLDRLVRLTRGFERICFGSSGEFAKVSSPTWNNRLNEAFNLICKGSGRPPCWIHMLRGMSLSGSDYPFASVDSTDIAQNHHIKRNAVEMADRWDSLQCASRWAYKPVQEPLLALAAGGK